MLHLEAVTSVAYSLWLLGCGLDKRETARVCLSGGSRDLFVRRRVRTSNVAHSVAHPVHTCVFSPRV
jgi:hypothetical protein